MLHKKTVSPDTLELLTSLMKDEHLGNFFLVGGTALSLQIGHRISIDIDLFSQEPFDENQLSVYLETEKGLQLSHIDKHTIKGQINNIQVDLITHAYPLIKVVEVSESIRMAGLEDIAAMKLNAIIGNGTRLKDFVDVAFLSTLLSLSEMSSAYEKKYSTRNPLLVVKALSYHMDINFNEPIQYVSGTYAWKTFEARLKEMITYPEKIFPQL